MKNHQQDKLAIVEDIEVEYKKFYNECKQKHTEVKSLIDSGLNVLSNLKTLTKNQLDIELKTSVDELIKPIILANQKKIKKLYISSLAIIKKLVSYGLIKQKHSNDIIIILKDVLANSSEEFVQIKVIETLLPMVDPDVIQLSEEIVSNVMNMCLKFFSFKNTVFRNPLSALLKQLVGTVFSFLKDSLQPVIDKALDNPELMLLETKEHIINDNNIHEENESEKVNEEQDNKMDYIDTNNNNELKEETDNIENNEEQINTNQDIISSEPIPTRIDLLEYEDTDIYKSSFYLFTVICNLCEGIKNPIISTTIYSKCLGYELLSTTINITKSLFNYMPHFLNRLTSSIHSTLSKSLSSSYDYITCTKLCRLTVQIITNLLINCDLISFITKYAETTTINWQKQIGIESLSAIFGCSVLIEELSVKHETIYKEIYSTLNKISYAPALNKKGQNDLDEGNNIEKILQNKLIDNVNIYYEFESPPNTLHCTIFVLILDVYVNMKKTYMGMIPQEINEDIDMSKIKNIVSYQNDILISAQLALLQSTNDETIINTFIDTFMDFVYIYGKLSLKEIRDRYLKEMDSLIYVNIPSGGNNNYSSVNTILCEKIMKAIFTVFENSDNDFDESAFVCLITSMQKIYHRIINSGDNLQINPSEEFELDIYINHFEQIIKQYAESPIFSQLTSVLKSNAQSQTQPTPISNNITSTPIENEDKNNNNDESNNEDSNNGLFSKLKYAFGFMRTSQQEPSSKINIAKEREINKYLNNKLSSIFIIKTPTFNDTILLNLIKALDYSTLNILNSNHPYTIQYIHFNLVAYLEILILNYQRIHLFWEYFISITSEITKRQIKIISHFSIDTITISIMFLLNILSNHEQSEFPSSSENLFSYQYYQSKIFESLINISKLNLTQDINLNIIYNLNVIIHNITHLLNGEGFTSLFDIFNEQIKFKEEAQTENCFMLLELLFEDKNFNLLVPNNIESILMLLEKFVCYDKNENISKHAMKLFCKAGDLCQKFNEYTYIDDLYTNDSYLNNLNQMQKDFFSFYCDNVDLRRKYFDKVWMSIFYKIVNLACDHRCPIRTIVIETFKQLFLDKNNYISPETGLLIINECFLEVFDKVNEIYEDKMKKIQHKRNNEKELKIKKEEMLNKEIAQNINEQKHFQFNSNMNSNNHNNDSNNIITPSLDNISSNVFAFGDFQVEELKKPEIIKKKNNIYDNENIIKPTQDEINWETTFLDIILALSEVIPAYLYTNSNLGYSFYKENFFNTIQSKYTKVMKFTSPLIINEIMTSLYKISQANITLYCSNFEMFWPIYEEMSKFIASPLFIESFPKLANDSKMINHIISHLNSIYLCNDYLNSSNGNIISDNNFDNLLIILNSLIKSAYNNEGITVIEEPYKLLNDEAIVLDFAYEIQQVLIENNIETSLGKYSNFLCGYIYINLNDLHSEALCRKSLEMCMKLFTDDKLSMNIILKELPVFINQVKELICLRNKNEFVTNLITIENEYKRMYDNINNNINTSNENNKQLLWQYASNILMQIFKHIILYRNKEKNDISVLWEYLINAYETIFRQSEKGYKIPQNKYQTDKLITSCQEMEIEIIDFIVNCLLPNSFDISKEKQIKLLNLLDMGSNFDYSSVQLSSSSSAISSSISKVCVSNLFGLCKYKSEDVLRKEAIGYNENEYVEIKMKIAKMCTPILIKRCKEMLKKFLDDEIKSGSMPLSRARLADIRFILERLKDLEVYPNYHILGEENEEMEEKKNIMEFILMKKKSHLISLLPLLSEFITTKENDIKILVKDIFKIISNELGIK